MAGVDPDSSPPAPPSAARRRHRARTRAWRGAEIPAAGGTGNARSVGRVHSALACGGEVDGVRLLSEAGVERILEEQSHTTDLVLGAQDPLRHGLRADQRVDPAEPQPAAFFWGGYGGSLALIDLDPRMTVTYVMNKMSTGLAGDLRGADRLRRLPVARRLTWEPPGRPEAACQPLALLHRSQCAKCARWRGGLHRHLPGRGCRRLPGHTPSPAPRRRHPAHGRGDRRLANRRHRPVLSTVPSVASCQLWWLIAAALLIAALAALVVQSRNADPAAVRSSSTATANVGNDGSLTLLR